MAQALYGETDPTEVRYRGRAQTTEQLDSEYLLKLRLPFTQKGDVHLLTSGDELVVHVGTQKRNVVLPRALVGLPTLGARFEDDTLVIRFAKQGETTHGTRARR
jgi:arsenite-transporting ATPase